MSRFGSWALAALLAGAALLSGWAAVVLPPAPPEQASGAGTAEAVAYVSRLEVSLAEHQGALYQALAAPGPASGRQLDLLEAYLGEGAAWLERRGEAASAGALRTYLQAAAAARRAGRDQAATAWAGPVHQAFTQARAALERAAGPLGTAPAPPAPPGPERTALSLLALLCGLGALLALLNGAAGPQPEAPALAEAPPEPAHDAPLKGLEPAPAAAPAETALADQLRADLRAVAAVADTHAGQVANLTATARQLRRSLERAAAAARERQAAGARLAGGIGGVAEAVGALGARAEGIGATVVEIHRATASAATVAESAGQQAVALEAQAALTAQSLGALSDRAGQIESVVGAIKSIAVQTNMLALNAAVEAARAGERGRGFAVVADSVRKLALEAQRQVQEIDRRVAGLSEAARVAAGEAGEMRALAGALVGATRGAHDEFSQAAAAAAAGSALSASLMEELHKVQAEAGTLAAALAASAHAAPADGALQTGTAQVIDEARQFLLAASETAIALREMRLLAEAAPAQHSRVDALTAGEPKG